MRYIRFAFLAILAVALVTLAVANSAPVSLRLLPPALAELSGYDWQLEVPLFVVILGGIAAGLLIGFFWEWLREARIRAEARRKAREARELERELRRLKARAPQKDDENDLLAVLDEAG